MIRLYTGYPCTTNIIYCIVEYKTRLCNAPMICNCNRRTINTRMMMMMMMKTKKKLENGEITNALQLEGRPTSCQSLSALITTRMPSLKWLKLSVAVLQRLYCWYFTLCGDLDLWPLTWTFIVYRLYHGLKLCTKCERNRAICGGVIAIRIFDLMTLNMYHVLHYTQDSLHKV